MIIFQFYNYNQTFRKPEASLGPTEKYYFGAPVTIKKYPNTTTSGGGGLTRSYSSVQNIPSSGGTQYRRPEYHNSTGNIYRSSHINNNNRRNETHHLLANREKTRNTRNR